MDKCREEFEAWIIKSNATGRVPNFIMKNENGEYVDRQTTDLWISWQASRESMRQLGCHNIKTLTVLQQDAIIKRLMK